MGDLKTCKLFYVVLLTERLTGLLLSGNSATGVVKMSKSPVMTMFNVPSLRVVEVQTPAGPHFVSWRWREQGGRRFTVLQVSSTHADGATRSHDDVESTDRVVGILAATGLQLHHTQWMWIARELAVVQCARLLAEAESARAHDGPAVQTAVRKA